SPPATPISTLSLHDALPIYVCERRHPQRPRRDAADLAYRGGDRRASAPELPLCGARHDRAAPRAGVLGAAARCAERGLRPTRARSEEHTSELQSLAYLVCRL